MTAHHKLLARQLTRVGADLDGAPAWLSDLLGVVSECYLDYDADRRLLERSVEISSEELFQANAEMRAILSIVPDLFLWLDQAGTILSVHAGQSNDLVAAASSIVGKRVQKMPDPEVASLFGEALERVQQTRAPVSIEYRLEVNGTPMSYEARLLPLLKDQTLAIVRNITDRKLAEADLAYEKERLAVTVSSIADGVIATDTNGQVTMVNRAAADLCRTSEQDGTGLPITEIFRLRDEKTDDLLDPVGEVLSGNDAWFVEREALLELGNGERVEVSFSVSAIRDQASRTIGVAVCFRDIGERRAAEGDRLRASKLDSIGLLAGGIAHDFNNILMSLLASASLAKLETKGHSRSVTELLDEIEMATHRARDLTQQLLTFSKGGAPVKESGSIVELLRESTVFALRGSNVRCQFHFAEGIPAVDMDTGQMSQVIGNLVINADQAMPNGGTIHISAAPCAETNGVCVEISDEGVGIPADFVAKIFDPYFTTKQKGSGLGLATSYSIVKNHGGQLSVESNVGKGTTFRFGIPASVQGQLEAKDEPVLHRGKGRILVLDDEAAIQRVASRMLKHLGYEPTVAGSGEEALSLFVDAKNSGDPYCAVVMDLTIPGAMGGVDAMKRLRSLDSTVFTVASSGYSNDPVLANHADYGFSAALAKPYTIHQFSAALSGLSS